MSDQQPVLIMAGGTGGHVYPALAVAKSLMAQNIPVVWMGTRTGLEARVIPENNIPMEWLKISGVRGKGKATLLLAPFKILMACLQAMMILKRIKPRCVLGMGGFVSGPGGLMASLMGIPLVIHEQNAIPGLTNNKLSKKANAVLEAFPESFVPSVGAQWVGNPVRDDILQLPSPNERLRLDNKEPLRLLVVGGSLGAKALNDIVPEAIAMLDESIRPQVRHQAGRQHHQDAIKAYKNASVEAQVDAFIEDMAAAFNWADLVICRSGAMTVSELAVVGVPAILVPFPFAVDDHQTANAMFLASKKGAVLIQQSELEAEQLSMWVKDFSENRDKLLGMAETAKSLGKPESTQLVVESILAQGGDK